ncbi:FAS1-like dehydratase domain-containing protein [Amaricoccus solimangrovi]|nr:MaoC family dehydratase N-terminal domain-containing protein [Amaricoccus solimangrovi]
MEIAPADVAGWIGRSETAEDDATPLLARRMAGLLDRDAPEAGEVWPHCWIWALFWPALRHDATGPDGHAARGGFLPPIDLPRRMWGGSRILVETPIRVGEHVSRRSTITKVAEKSGRTGRLCFVTVEHRLTAGGAARLTEIQTIAYRGAAGAAAAPAEPGPGPDFEPMWRRRITPDAVLLYQYSAATFNTHRIHYDHPYATGVEGYPGLVVHGPLTATMLMELLGANLPAAMPRDFQVTALRPLYAPAPFDLVGRVDGDAFRLLALTGDGHPAMRIEGTLG